MSKVEPTLNSALAKTAAKLTAAIRKDAIASGWPIKYASALSVKVVKATVKIEYPDALAAEIEDLEYGTQDSSPRPVIRVFMNKHGDIISDAIAEASVDYAFKETGIV